MKIVEYNDADHYSLLLDFFADSDVVNNMDMASLGLDERPRAKMFLVMIDERIINLSYAHDFSEYYPDSFRIFTRTATLPMYRGKFYPKQKSMVSMAGVAAYTTPMQVDYALEQGAKKILFTTNRDEGMESSCRLGKLLHVLEPTDPRFSFFDNHRIYGCQQDVWQLHYRDIINLSGEI